MSVKQKSPSVAVIGCGHWGQNLVRNFYEIGVLKTIADPSPSSRERMKEKYGVSSSEVNEILDDASIEAVVVAVPAELHHDVASRALKAGKHVFVEKPIALTLEHASELIYLAAENKRTLMVGHLLQYHPGFLKLKDMVRTGELGKLRYLYSRRLSIGKLRSHENVLWSFAPHDLSMVLALAGCEPEKVSGFAGNFLQSKISDFASVQLDFPGNIKAHIDVSWLNPIKEQKLVVVGEKAMVVFDDQAPKDQKLVMFRHQAAIIHGVPELTKADPESISFDDLEPLRNECMHFLQFCATGETPFTDGMEAMAVLKVLCAADAGDRVWTGVLPQ